MNLQEIFNTEPEEGIVIEFPKDSNIFHIPILEVKKLLSRHFVKWETKNFHFQIHQIGLQTMIAASVELHLLFREDSKEPMIEDSVYKYQYIGTTTFDCKNYTREYPEISNDNWTATALSECIKNAAKNIGRYFGMFLNSTRISDHQPPEKKSTKTPMDNTIKNILKTKK